jgi:CopG family transcriptional regulator, nickel-responsive regulator
MGRRRRKPKEEPQLVRFGVSIPQDLSDQYDEHLGARGHANRSEAIRELIRETLAQEAWTSGDGVQAAVLTFVVDTQKPEPLRRVLDCHQAMGTMVTSTMHSRFNAREEIWVLLLKGKSPDLRERTNEVLGIKGVSLGKLVVAGKASE